MSEELTPMMKQYKSLKNKYDDSILFFRLGDFYEVFEEDAKVAARLLDIALTSRNKGSDQEIPMAGVPAKSASSYIATLIENGYKVAICEQMEDASEASGLVERDVIRVITPGTVIEDEILPDNKNNYLASLKKFENKFGFAFLDISTGEFSLTEVEDFSTACDEIDRLEPSEIIISEDLRQKPGWKHLDKNSQFKYTASSNLSVDNSEKILKNFFAINSLQAFGCENMEAGLLAAAEILKYSQETQKQALDHITGLNPYYVHDYMVLDSATRRNLELTETIRDKKKSGSLMSILDETVTSMGSRLLRKWINQPLLDVEKIKARHKAVEELLSNYVGSRKLQDILSEVYDLERLQSKISYESINPRDMGALRSSLGLIPDLKAALEKHECQYIKSMADKMDLMEDLREKLEEALVAEPPHSPKEGGLIKSGYNEKLDSLRENRQEAKDWIAELQPKERERTGIDSLKVGFNKVFGYYIEVTNANLDKVPDDYTRKQTLSNSERYIIPELKEKEAAVLGAEEKINDLEYDIFCELRDFARKNLEKLKQTAKQIARLDVLLSFAQIALENDYCKPLINKDDLISITKGRHPVVEEMVDVDFVPNHTTLDCENNRFLIITGPNMSGKSTYLRQVAIITLMAQIGSFVPADSASIGMVDRIFTRVGASDDLSTGQSTFMVEMNEVSNIVNNATKDSLIILDEVGRGTSTYDGLSIAWAVSKYINDPGQIGARTLFATHYHELTELAKNEEGVKNLNVVVEEEENDIHFMYHIEPGSAEESYGIEVAKLAGLPEEIIEEARAMLVQLERKQQYSSYSMSSFAKNGSNNRDNYIEEQAEQLQFFSLESQDGRENFAEIKERLEELDVNNTTPLEALEFLHNLKQEIIGNR